MSSFDLPQISFGGLASGLDTNAIISSLVSVESIPINLMKKGVSGYESKVTQFDKFKTYLKAFQSAAQDLKDSGDFNVFSVVSGNESIATATSSSSGSLGSYNLEVMKLAKAGQEISENLADKNTTQHGSGTITFSVGGVDTDVTIAEDSESLADIAAAINDADAGVTASIINDGSASPYRLVVTSDDTGLANAVSVDLSGLTVSGGDVALADFTTLQDADDASFKIMGLTMSRSSNTVTDAVEGLTITLKGTTELDTPITLSVERDTESLTGKFQAYVDAYNDVNQFFNNQSKYNETTESGGVLTGESLLRSMQTKLQMLLTPAWSTGADAPEMQILAQAGITFENDGSLKLDTAELESALGSNFEDVVTMFIDPDKGFGHKMDAEVYEYTKLEGFIDGRKNGLKSIIDDMNKQILKAEERLDTFEANLVKKFAALESLMSGLQQQQSFLYYQDMNKSS